MVGCVAQEAPNSGASKKSNEEIKGTSSFGEILYKFGLRRNKTYYLPHFVKLDNKDISITKELRTLWILKEAQNIKKSNEPVLCVYGEFSSTETVEVALKNGFDVHVIFGKAISTNSKHKVKKLKEDYPDKFRLYTHNQERPHYHSSLIGNNLFFEDEHDQSKSYKTAKIIEYADPKWIETYKQIFDKYLMSSTEIETPEDIESLDEC